MANLPKKGDQVPCITARNSDAFPAGCSHDAEKVGKAKRLVNVSGDDGNLHEIDFPQVMTMGQFEIND
ncbi:hypothetical protein HOS16_gp46 [Shigella phage vB_SflS-ISF001]|uniref:Uncharacterized protein n=1 Tax=Shigella phage vB_SflS-ISF001 TaxID=2048005 RepID=A0A2D1GQ47_9CAUD|nr:hypothetical protein HOS16_gp46 [Shigella phage vB_SflS-ISF001]ATN94124.1 hypothetical protein FLXISF001_046 [Shigella phage vB_SflS-ISF001]